jgi:hypothetical protein
MTVILFFEKFTAIDGNRRQLTSTYNIDHTTVFNFYGTELKKKTYKSESKT